MHDVDAALRHDFHLGLGGVVGTANDGTSVAHLAALGGGLSGDEADNGLRAVPFYIMRCFGLHAAADFTDHDDAVGIGVVHQHLHSLLSGGAHDGVAADADAGALAHARLGHLVNGLIGERARAAHDADAAGIVDEARHDAALGLAGCDDAGAIWPHEAAFGFVFEVGFHLHHVLHGDALGDADDDFDSRIGSLHDGVGCEWRWYEDDGNIRPAELHGVGDGIVNGLVQMAGATLAGRNATDEVGAVFKHLCCVEGAFFASETLDDDAGVFVY